MLGSIAALMLASLAIMGSPGPATVSCAAASSAYGVRRALPYAVGVTLGTVVVLLAVVAGITATLLAVPSLGAVLVVASAVYILRLAYRIATAPPIGAQSRTGDAPSFGGGVLLGVANPKAWLAIAATLGTARLAPDVELAVLAVMVCLFMSSWTLAGAAFAPLLRDERRARIVNRTLAAALVAATGIAVAH
jgi:threonine/homoserine/homoserine lactone efflux protein